MPHLINRTVNDPDGRDRRYATDEHPALRLPDAGGRTLPQPDDLHSERISAHLPEYEPEDTLPDQLDSNSR